MTGKVEEKTDAERDVWTMPMVEHQVISQVKYYL